MNCRRVRYVAGGQRELACGKRRWDCISAMACYLSYNTDVVDMSGSVFGRFFYHIWSYLLYRVVFTAAWRRRKYTMIYFGPRPTLSQSGCAACVSDAVRAFTAASHLQSTTVYGVHCRSLPTTPRSTSSSSSSSYICSRAEELLRN